MAKITLFSQAIRLLPKELRQIIMTIETSLGILEHSLKIKSPQRKAAGTQ
jgi:hypothetical protein